MSFPALRGARRSDVLVITFLLILGVALPLMIGTIAGSLEVPRLDDWAYRRIALDLARTGVLVLDVRTSIIGEVLIAQPFLWLSSLQPWGFAAAGVFFAAWGVLSAYALARQFLPPLRAAVPALLLLIYPGYLAYATSFMSDVPALAAQFTCLVLGVVALRRRPVAGRWLLGSVVLGGVAMSMRDFALAAPAAVMAAALCVDPRRVRHWALAGVVVVCYGLVYLLRLALYPRGMAVEIASGGLFQSLQALAIVSLVVSPAVLVNVARWRPLWRGLDVAIGAELGIAVVGLRLLQGYQQGIMPLAILPGIASQSGIPGGQMFLGDRPPLFGNEMWLAVNLTALAATIVVLGACFGVVGALVRGSRRSRTVLVQHAGPPLGLLTLYSLVVAAGLAAYGLNTPVFDRYFWVLVPPVATTLLYVPKGSTYGRPTTVAKARPIAMAPAVLSTAALGCVAVVFALNSNAFDASLWRGGQALVGAGIRPDEIDAGYSWVGYHASTPPTGGGSSPVYYRQIWPQFRECGFVTSNAIPQPDTALVGSVAYSLYLIAGPTEPLYLFRDTGPQCQAK